MPCLATLETALGWLALAWRDDALLRMTLGHGSEPAAIRALLDAPELAGHRELGDATTARVPWRLRERLKKYAEGKPDDFADVPVELSHLTDFQRAVIRACRKIGYGKTKSYGELAKAVGKPRAARAVGTVMSSNRVPLIVPCHRVLAAGGKLGGYSGPRGTSLKTQLLRLEGLR